MSIALTGEGTEAGSSTLHLASGAIGAVTGPGFDATQVQLIADQNVSDSVHAIQTSGDCGDVPFEIRGRALPVNATSTALAAMSVIGRLKRENGVSVSRLSFR